MLDVDADPITAHEDNVEDLDMDYGSRKVCRTAGSFRDLDL